MQIGLGLPSIAEAKVTPVVMSAIVLRSNAADISFVISARTVHVIDRKVFSEEYAFLIFRSFVNRSASRAFTFAVVDAASNTTFSASTASFNSDSFLATSSSFAAFSISALAALSSRSLISSRASASFSSSASFSPFKFSKIAPG